MVRFGIIGTGRISDWILQGAVLDPRFKAVAICSRSRESARKFAAEHPVAFGQNTGDVKVFTSVEQIASCPDIDAIYIGTPNKTHLPYTLTCLNAGKNVLCEKPLGCSEDEVRQMIEAARRNGCLLMEAMVSTLDPIFRAAREHIAEIGPVRHFSASYCQYSSKYDDLQRGIVSNSFNPKMGGGALPDVGIYTTYPLVSLFGYPLEVHPELINIPSSEGDVNVHGNVSLKYPGMTADLVFSKAVDSFAPTEICGENGNIILDQIHIARRASLVPHGTPCSGRGKVAEPVTIAEGVEKDIYYYEFKEFIDLIQDDLTESGVNSLETSLLNARLIDAIYSGGSDGSDGSTGTVVSAGTLRKPR